MAIIRIELKDFLVFMGRFTLDFCPGINVLIGGNGIGKTTLLKCLYGSTDTIGYKTSRYFNAPGFEDSKDDVYISRISLPKEQFNNLYKEDRNNLSPVAVFVSQSEEWSQIDNDFHSKINEIASHSEQGKKLNDEYLSNPLAFNINKKSVMIPSTEMLSHSKGLLALCNRWKMPFDQNEIDILVNAQLPETIEIKPNTAKILEKIERIIGGGIVCENETFFTQKESGENIPFTLEASGFKKVGLLWKLLRNGLLESGTTLLWDEPENSLNPELVPELVDILLELSRNGVQIFIATHSEIFVSYFAVNRRKGDSVMFYSLFKDGEQIKANASDRFDLLEPNNLTAEIVRLYEKEIERGLGGNG